MLTPKKHYTIYINPRWHSPIVVYQKSYDPWSQNLVYYNSRAVLTVRDDEILLLRNCYTGDIVNYTHPPGIAINPSLITQLLLGTIPNKLVTYLTNRVPMC